MKIPLFDLNFNEEEEKAVIDTLRSKWISTGPRNAELEEKFSSMVGARHAVALANCTSALHLAMIVCGIGKGDEVLVPSLTFAATVNSVLYTGATPVFCDVVSTEDLNIDPEDIRNKITSRTKAVVVMHYGGFPCDMDTICAIARENNLKIIEDACHGPLSEYKGRKLGTIGDVGCFSFFSNKNISTGEGGIAITDSSEYNDRLRLLRSHGMTTLSYERSKGHATMYDIIEAGYNYRMDDIRASIAVVQLGKLKADIARRQLVREAYLSGLGAAAELTIPFRDNREPVSNYIMPVVLKGSTPERRDRIREKLQSLGIGTSVHYPPVHRFSVYHPYSLPLPVTEYVTDNEITLPMYSALTSEQIDYICRTLLSVIREG